ncbi:SusC/RagA family TonB-linked outer membrane protein [Chitinophaga rhizophila]|uniref:SusC/RagA family TonB-linked outer membrane protein n=1 Tax=Chitinophaga rhizophila TaxID=2866212 RepID=A0ABS7G5M7_9BACT|nr:SusC/RagA family TonB-linked outer membrane protein [Chitinophaga rhizophila]MBW8682943.1 SusC/RagA family TonB-linked outer membrane protein [Chitinophaga rhizophila]
MDKSTNKRGGPLGDCCPQLKAMIRNAGLLVLLFLTAWMPAVYAQTGEQRLDISIEGQPLKSVFQFIEKNTAFVVNHSEDEINTTVKVAVNLKGATVPDILRAALRTTEYGFVRNGNTFVITRRQPDIVIRGKVADEKGEALIGVNVRPKNGARGTITNKDGQFTIAVPSPGTSLVFSFLGYTSRTIPVAETQTLNVQMIPDAKALNEVVVTTALGIKREEKALGYAATIIKNEQLTDAVSNNWTDALSGKVAGLNLVRSNAGPTGSNKIILRGESNLSGDNEALIVVDGVVINQSSGRRSAIAGETPYGTGSDNMPADYGSGLNDINPEDIETITVLKGPGAAALYGQRGANGALIITTKSGSPKRKGLGVSFNSNAAVEQVNRWPALQYEYGQGLDGAAYYSYGASADGASTSGTSSSYGPRFEGQQFFQYDPVTQAQGKERTPWVPYKDQLQQFFQNGQTFTNSISLDGGTDKTTARFSFTNVTNKWIIPNTGYGRNTVAMSINSKVNDKLQISSKVNYTNKFSDNLPGSGYGNQSLMYWYIFWQPNADLDWLRNYWANGQEGKVIKYPFSSFPENPYAVAYEFLNQTNRHGITGNIQATYNIVKGLSLQIRTSIDFANEHREQKRPYDAGAKFRKGSFRTQNIFGMEASSDFLLKYQTKIGRDLEVSVTGGGSTLRNTYNRDEVRADSLTFPGIYTMANAAGPLVTMPHKSEYAFNSFYGLLALAYKDYLFVDFTGRQDWASPLATPRRTTNAGFFYPSANLSFIASEVFKMPKQVDLAKLRLSASSVGSGGTIAYQTAYVYQLAGSLYSGGLENPAALANPNLRPLRTISYEAGATGKFFNKRVGFDLALYKGLSRDQHLQRVVDRASGYSTILVNAGEVSNSGIELALNGTPISTRSGFKWNTNIVFSSNRNKIEKLLDSSLVLKTGYVGGGQIVAQVGGSMGDLYGRGYQRSPDGQVIYDGTTGVALITEGVKYLGNTIPKWKLGFSNDFTYKQFHLSLLFDAQYGGVAHSLMHYKLAEQGKTVNTLPGRYNGIIGNGVIADGDGKYRRNDVIATDIDEYYRSHYGVDNAEGSTFRTDFIKFREARLDYSLNPKLAKRIGFQRASFGVYGRNLHIWSKWPMFDPEFGTITGTDIVQGFEVGQFPSTRTFGCNLVLVL